MRIWVKEMAQALKLLNSHLRTRFQAPLGSQLSMHAHMHIHMKKYKANTSRNIKRISIFSSPQLHLA